MGKTKTKEHPVQVGEKHLAGYEKNDRITDWKGKDTGWKVYDRQQVFTNEYGEKFYSVILVRKLKHSEKYAVGYSLGEGMLVRAEESTDWTGKRMEQGHLDTDELWRTAEAVSQYWHDLDVEDAQRFDEDQAQDHNEQESG